MRVPKNSMIVVADGRKMLFFRNEGDAERLDLQVERKREQDNPSHSDQATDQAGRASNTIGGRASSMQEVDFHQQEEDRFAAETAEQLRKRALAGEFEDLIIIAPPQTLGELRKYYHKEVEKRLKGELAKDLTGHPVDQIQRILADH